MLLGAFSAQAADFTFDGNISYHNDVVQIDFTLDNDATDVKVWTDSFMEGLNFDPITAVWQQAGSDYALVGQNDDNPSIAPGQTYYDSGLVFDFLAAGTYKFTIAAYANFALGSSLSDGFIYGNDTPIPINQWWTGGDGYWRVHLSGVDDANPSPVPEPGTMMLMLAGLGLVGAAGRKRAAQDSI